VQSQDRADKQIWGEEAETKPAVDWTKARIITAEEMKEFKRKKAINDAKTWQFIEQSD
jgi:hypothetical protein